MKKSISSLFCIILLVFLIFQSCVGSSKSNKIQINYSEAIAQVINSCTCGTISPEQEIYISFQKPMVGKEITGKKIKNEVLNFDPKISGYLTWKDEKTLTFIPKFKLKDRQLYKGELILSKLIPGSENFIFNFYVKRLDLLSIDTEFVTNDYSKPDNVVLKGSIKFSGPINSESIKDAIKLQIGTKKVPIKIVPSNDINIINIISEPIEKDNKTIEGKLLIDSKKSGISKDIDKKIILYSKNIFEPISFKSTMIKEKPFIIVSFNSEIDETQDFRGFVSVTPEIDFTAYASGTKLYLSGNFNYNTTYIVNVKKGIRSKFEGLKLSKDFSSSLKTSDLSPAVKFSSNGIFMPSDNNQKLLFMTLNLTKVRLIIMRIYENNLCQFFQEESINSSPNRKDSFRSIYRVGVEVYNDTLEINSEQDTWLQHEIDLSKLVKGNESGLFMVSLFFMRNDIFERDEDSEEEDYDYDYYDDYYYDYYNEDDYYYMSKDNEKETSYYYLINRAYGKAFKLVSMSDIGLIYKQTAEESIVYATDLLTSKPLQGVNISLYSYQNQLLASGITEKNGKVSFKGNYQVYFVKGEKNGQRSFIQNRYMALNLTNYDIGGVELSEKQLRVFAYTERGIYRPGDEIHLTAIIRNQFNTFPDGHPVTLKFYNPKNTLVYYETQNNGIDGMYSFTIKTQSKDITGTWNAYLEVAGEKFIYPVKIEMIVPYTIKINVNSSTNILTPKNDLIKLDISANYLTGLAAAGLKYTVTTEYRTCPKKFQNLPAYSFDDKTLKYEQPESEQIASGTLDSNGEAVVSYSLPYFVNKPSALELTFTIRVIEKGGRPVIYKQIIPVEMFDYYVGWKLPQDYSGYVKKDSPLSISIVNLKSNGDLIAGRKIEWRIYHSQRWWWWDYYYDSDFSYNFRNQTSTSLWKEGELKSDSKPVILTINPDISGTYLVELIDQDGHTSTFFFFAYSWGSETSEKDAAYLMLRSDNKEYSPGDIAKVTFPSPSNGSVLISIERANIILNSYWLTATQNDNGEMTIEIPITKEMCPNIYVTIMLIQPHAETINDRPLRMFGIIPLIIKDKSTIQNITIKTSDNLKPNSPFTVEVQTTDGKPTQFTIAVVDVGLLDLTAFKTPDPWADFNKKLKYGVFISDLFDSVLDLNKGDIKNRFAVGGSEADSFASAHGADSKAMRFKPVSIFKGPLQTDSKGYSKIEFFMPDYIGAVRIMVVSASKGRYGSAEKEVKVTQELMVSSSLPRFLRPGDTSIIATTIMGTIANLGKINVKAKITGPAKLINMDSQDVVLLKPGESTIYFTIKADNAVGVFKFNVTATNGVYTASQTTEMDILAASPREYKTDDYILKKGNTLKFTLPSIGLEGSNEASINVSSLFSGKLSNHLKWLIRYPYGCIEQTISSVFPQLYLKEIISIDEFDKNRIDYYIMTAISKLRSFQKSNGGFSYWPGQNYVNIWASNYAGNFLIEAKNKGYYIPEDMIKKWVSFTKKNVRNTINHNIYENIYSLYLLALAGEPDIGSMNLIREYYENSLADIETWLLAAAYKLSGIDKTAEKLISTINKRLPYNYDYNDETFGSYMRDKSMILGIMLIFSKDMEANKLFKEIIEELRKNKWYSTQELGFALLNIGKYLNANGLKLVPNGKIPKISGYITLPNGEKVRFNEEKYSFSIPINAYFGQELSITIDESTEISSCFIEVVSSGVPLFSSNKNRNNGIYLNVEYLDENGIIISNKNFKQGQIVWIEFKVENLTNQYLYNLAMVHLLPAGLEYSIERIKWDNRPEWESDEYKFIEPEYVDIRDDRAFVFFNFKHYTPTIFYLKANVVTPGTYTVPSSYVEAMYNSDYFGSTESFVVNVTNANASFNPLAKPKD